MMKICSILLNITLNKSFFMIEHLVKTSKSTTVNTEGGVNKVKNSTIMKGEVRVC
jgi:hypothetical protein